MRKFICIISVFLIMCLTGCSGQEEKNSSFVQTEISGADISAAYDTSSGAADISSEIKKEGKTFSKELLRVKEEYKQPVKGSVKTRKVTYTHKDHTKNAIVYLPPEYDKSHKYNIVYILGGVTSNERAFFGQEGRESEFKNILDNMILNGDIDPCIVVNLAFYPSEDIQFGDEALSVLLEDFNEELRDVIIPAVESKYTTYAESTSPEGIRASREHRGISGFSMGGAVAWNTLAEDIDYFSLCIPMAAGSFEDYDNNDYNSGIAEKLKSNMASFGYDSNDFFIFACEGTEDVTYEKMEQLISRFRNSYTDIFKFTDDDTSKGNITYKVKQGAKHEYSNAYEYFCNALTAW